MNTETYDVIVIGGGINGAGVAQAAAAAGLRTLVVEQQQAVGMETSSRSSKLVHGGLRYLESLEFSLVRESLQERDLLLKLAPDLVHLTRFNIPLYRDTRRSSLTLHAGLSLYAILAGLQKRHLYRLLRPQDWGDLDGISQQQLQSVFQYRDAQTDDQALTRAVMQSALDLGAELILNARLVQGHVDKQGVEVEVEHAAKTDRLSARAVVNAAGPWVADVIDKIQPAQSFKPPDLVLGTHLVMQSTTNEAYYLEAPQDGRAVFVLPWKGHTLLGTTERVYRDDPALVAPSEAERTYLLEVYRHYFPANDDQVLSEMAGCRVLPAAGNNLFKRSRETVFEINQPYKPRLVSIVGGKLTVYRRTALKTMDYLRHVLPQARSVADTASLPLRPVDKLDGEN